MPMLDPDCTVRVSSPILSNSAVTDWFNPSPIEASPTIAPIPIIIPSSVNKERSLCIFRLRKAIE